MKSRRILIFKKISLSLLANLFLNHQNVNAQNRLSYSSITQEDSIEYPSPLNFASCPSTITKDDCKSLENNNNQFSTSIIKFDQSTKTNLTFDYTCSCTSLNPIKSRQCQDYHINCDDDFTTKQCKLEFCGNSGNFKAKDHRNYERSCLVNKCLSEARLLAKIKFLENKKKDNGKLGRNDLNLLKQNKRKLCAKQACQGLLDKDFEACENTHCTGQNKRDALANQVKCVFGSDLTKEEIKLCGVKMIKFARRNQVKEYCWNQLNQQANDISSPHSSGALYRCLQHVDSFANFDEKTKTSNIRTIYKNLGFGHCREVIFDKLYKCISQDSFNCEPGEHFKTCGNIDLCGRTCQNPKGYDTLCPTECEAGCYCKPGMILENGKCIREKQCPARCNKGDCPSIKIPTFINHMWVISLKSYNPANDRGTILAVFQTVGDASKVYQLTVHRDLSVTSKQPIKGDNSNGKRTWQYKLITDIERLETYFGDKPRNSTQSDKKISLEIENRSWQDLQVEWIDFEGRFVDLDDINFIQDSENESESEEEKHADISEANQLISEKDPDSDQKPTKKPVSKVIGDLNKDKNPSAKQILANLNEEEVIKCRSIRNEPCSYNEIKVPLDPLNLRKSLFMTIFTIKGGNFEKILPILVSDLQLFYQSLLTKEGQARTFQANLLSKVKIYLNDGIIFGRPKEATKWSGSVFHPGRPWLAERGNLVDKVGSIEFYTTDEYLVRRSHHGRLTDPETNKEIFSNWQIIHEISHWYHWYLTNYGWSKIDDIWNKVMTKGREEYANYNSVRHVSGALRKSYASVNSQEYFASLSAAYFSKGNDYYPFVLEDIKEFDRFGYDLVKSVWSYHKNTVEGMHVRSFRL